MTSSNERNGRVKNQIGRYLAARIVQAYENNEEFKIYVIIPSVPGKAEKTLVKKLTKIKSDHKNYY